MRFHYLSTILLVFTLLSIIVPVFAMTLATVTITAAEFNASYSPTAGLFPSCKIGYLGNLSAWTATITVNLTFSDNIKQAGLCFSSSNYSGYVSGYDSFRVYVRANDFKLQYATPNGSWVYLTTPDYYPYNRTIKIMYSDKTISVWAGETYVGNATLHSHVSPCYIHYKTNVVNPVVSGDVTIVISRSYLTWKLVDVVDVVIQLLPAFVLIGCLGVAFAVMKSAVRE